jgi:hypothetical protein
LLLTATYVTLKLNLSEGKDVTPTASIVRLLSEDFILVFLAEWI